MFLLTDIFDDNLQYEDHLLTIDLSFDNVLRLFELFNDEDFQSQEKILIALEMLIVEYEVIKEISFDDKLELYVYIMKEFLGIDLGNQEVNTEKRTMDFSKDAELIYASFLSEYNIDLFEEHGKLHWKKFSALLSNLNDSTAFKEVVKYRTMKIPSSKDASEEYIKHIRDMKKAYSLENEEENQEGMENKLDSIASTFSRGGTNE